MCSVKKSFLEISQNSEENICARDKMKYEIMSTKVEVNLMKAVILKQ